MASGCMSILLVVKGTGVASDRSALSVMVKISDRIGAHSLIRGLGLNEVLAVQPIQQDMHRGSDGARGQDCCWWGIKYGEDGRCHWKGAGWWD